MDGTPKIVGFSPQIIHFDRVFHYKPWKFWGSPIFGNTHVWTERKSKFRANSRTKQKSDQWKRWEFLCHTFRVPTWPNKNRHRHILVPFSPHRRYQLINISPKNKLLFLPCKHWNFHEVFSWNRWWQIICRKWITWCWTKWIPRIAPIGMRHVVGWRATGRDGEIGASDETS